MNSIVNNNSEDNNGIDMLEYIKNCLNLAIIYEVDKKIIEYLYNFFRREKEKCEKQFGKIPEKANSCFPISYMIELGVKILVGMVVAQIIVLIIFESQTGVIRVLGNIIMLLIFIGVFVLPFAVPIYKKRQEKKKIEQDYLQECKENARLEELGNKKLCVIKANINKLTEAYKYRNEQLEKLYSSQFIYKKYQSLEACCTILEYLESGRCNELNGPYGAYNKYDSEVASEHVVEHLSDDIMVRLANDDKQKRILFKNQILLLEKTDEIITWVKKLSGEYSSLKLDNVEETDINEIVNNTILMQWINIILEEDENFEDEKVYN